MPVSIERNQKTKQFFFRIKAGNYKPVGSGETYTKKENAVGGLIAIAKEFGSPGFDYWDNTLKTPVLKHIDLR